MRQPNHSVAGEFHCSWASASSTSAKVAVVIDVRRGQLLGQLVRLLFRAQGGVDTKRRHARLREDLQFLKILWRSCNQDQENSEEQRCDTR